MSFIVFEGIDRSGKTTQLARLAATLRTKFNKKVVEMRFPNYNTPTGALLREYLMSKTELEPHVAHLLFSANRWETMAEIRQHCADGSIVLCDRFVCSGIAYSMAKGLDFEWCTGPDTGLQPEPTCVVYLDVPTAIAAQRANYGVGDCHEKIEFQTRVRFIYEKYFAHKIDWLRIKADDLDADSVASLIEQNVACLIKD